jgi:hypothetical protein
MNSRERLLSIVIGSVLLIVVGFIYMQYVMGQFSTRSDQIAKLESDIAKAKKDIFAGQLAMKKISEYETRSLPPDVEAARTQYQDWLLSEIQKAGLLAPDVDFKSSMPEGDLYVRQTFAVGTKGTLPQVVDMLHAFYSVDWLHRITQLRLKPIKDSKLLDVTFSIEALSLRKAKETAQLELRPSKRLKLADRKAYQEAISSRNLFGPPNNAPKITVSGSKDVYLGRAADLTVKGTDPDARDKVRYRLVKAPDESAKFDEQTGRLTWTPREKGQYEFIFEGIDDGLPNKTSNTEKIVLTVSDQPPPQKPQLEFDHARHTVLTAVLDLDGRGEIWLHVRPIGQTVKLHAGDQFEIGSIKGTVDEIGQYDFSFKSDGKLRKLAKGDVLEQAKVIGDLPADEAPKAAEAGGASGAKPASAEKPETQLTAEDRKGS